MTALGKLLRTTAFKIVAVYLIVFALFAIVAVGYLARHTQALVVSQITEAIDSEVRNLEDLHADGGIGRLIDVVVARAQQPGSNLYLITSFNGAVLASNVTDIDNAILSRPGWSEISYRRTDEAADSLHDSRALVRVVFIGGFRVLVGRDIEERERLREILAAPARWALVIIVILGIAGGAFIVRRVMKRIDSMTATSAQIMSGDFGGRLAVTGSGDEFDRLANSLNTMLARIENLMGGLKHVSDNIAHDLKTPLTRLRNRAEEALRQNKTEAELRRALESTIEESDNLIRTFDALLMISRAEAGEVRKTMIDFDAADIVRDVAELYEPVAEESGLSLAVDAGESLPVRGSRELVSQALANLVDNAIKHGGTVRGSKVTIAARRAGDNVEFSVGDRGPGIPEADRLRVLERFVRLEESRSRPGAGLGLSLAQAVARLHGGELRLEDNLPGLKVTLAIPAQPGQTKGA
ncbi:MAG: HAMP domain-containing protein [Xanthobacteraceae bacterium]|nr:HAMP domain-containing protein [Xanthobacteraceae bacterium]